MFSKCSVSVVAGRTQTRLFCCAKQYYNNPHSKTKQCRTFSTSKSASLSNPISFQGVGKPLLSGLTDELDRIAPRFDIDGENIDILQEPSDFFEALKVGTN